MLIFYTLDPPRRSGRIPKDNGGVQARLQNIEKSIRPDLYTDRGSVKAKGVNAKAANGMSTNPMAPQIKAPRGRAKASVS